MEIEAPAEGERSFAVAAAVVVERWRSVPQGTDRGELNPLIREALHASTFNTRADVADVYGDVLKRVYAESKTAPAAAGTASAPAVDDARRQLLEMVAGRDSPSYFPKGHTRNYMSRQPKDAFGGLLLELDKMAVKSPHAPGRAMVLHDTPEPYEPRILVRGNATQPGRHVPRRFLEVLGREERTPFGNGSGRLDLAHAITAPDNPLTSRVIVNRVWMQHFGEPLVGTPSDFGTRSTPPTHPELLDHLATRFMAEGWSLKELHRWILASKTWQQSSAPESAAAARGQSADPENRLLWRAHRRRLEFEAMRDTLLAASGRLTEKPGGRPVDVTGDPQCTVRTVYAMVDRQSLPGLFRAFDFAAPDHSVERRPRTMVPQQALFALNSPFMIEQARGLAARTNRAGDPAARVTALYRAAFARDPTTEEVADAVAFVEMPVDAQSQLSAWEQLAQVLLCSNELMYLD
jgi:hypothetical protein